MDTIRIPALQEEDKTAPIANHNAAVRTKRKKGWLWENLLLWLTVAGVLLGVGVGALGRLAKPAPDLVSLIAFPGEVLVRLLKMFILPLIISSLISGTSQLGGRSLGRLGVRALVYYGSTSLLAAVVGVTAVLVVHPGRPDHRQPPSHHPHHDLTISTLDSILDLVRNLFPENLVQACFQQVHTTYPDLPSEGANSSSVEGGRTELEYRDGTNVLGIIVFSIGFGIVAGRMGQRSKVIVDFFVALNEIIMKLVGLVLWYSPVGLACLVAGKLLSVADLAATFSQLAIFVATVIAALLFHAVVTLPAIYFLVTRKNPAVFFRGILHAWITAFATASSSASLPVTIACLEENNGVDRRVSRLVASVGSTVNMDGTALYEAIAAIFVAQIHAVSLSFGGIITVSLTATLSSLGAASVPSTGLVSMLIVLTALGLPTSDVALLLTVDWILDRVRTSISVVGDGFGAGVVEHLSKEELRRADEARLELSPLSPSSLSS